MIMSGNGPLSDTILEAGMTVINLPRAATVPTLDEASRAFLRRDAFEPTTRRSHAATLDALANLVDGQIPVDEIGEAHLEALLGRWRDRAPATSNRQHQLARRVAVR
jgi:hypothetical protein